MQAGFYNIFPDYGLDPYFELQSCCSRLAESGPFSFSMPLMMELVIVEGVETVLVPKMAEPILYNGR